ncbi:hypothetical protein KDX38_04265 [Pseudomonas sp. CDFA 602]|uniref:hypothetical protein n=1 Tax=Pseudomonas californiensis TaxID=2829823 RepID=UPI001E2FC04D|nr:hypothetical protein [Pseudomonas californiensis]MCD5993052.1 hypothetical protein [Pseudomonas californiensis]MCD5998429.1 hypothetical protein [Pseudomonas californiensis]
MNTFNQHFEFAAPRVPVASPVDGMMPVDSLDRPIIVEIVLWSGAQKGYYLELVLDSVIAGESRILTETDIPGDIIKLALDERYLKDAGRYTLGFQVTNPINEVQENSPLIPLIIDRTAPGSTLLAAIIFPHFNYGEVLSGVIPGYADMQVGDSIQTLCNGVAGPVHIVVAEDLTERPPHISFTREFLQGLDSENVTFTYQVSDRAGNASVMAQRVEMSMQR